MRVRLIEAIGFVAAVLLPAPALADAAIPLGTHDGIYTVPVEVNGSVTMEFLIDTGSSVVVIPQSVLDALVRNGTVSRSDVLGTGTAITADRTVYRSAQIRLRELRVGGIVVRDVVAAVSPALVAPLLGQSFLNRFPSVTFDNQRRLMLLTGVGPSRYGAAAPLGTR